MAKVITFSTTFPAYHLRAGEPTNFVDKILKKEKLHTIRMGRRWKTGEEASLRYWSGRPYFSKQIKIIDKNIRVIVKDILIGRTALGGVYIDFKTYPLASKKLLEIVAYNDGLTFSDFESWFSGIKPGTSIEAQIIYFYFNNSFRTMQQAEAIKYMSSSVVSSHLTGNAIDFRIQN